MKSTNSLPDYEKPPVNEVVCGILFEPIKSFSTPYLGILWEKFKSTYPRCKEVAPLVPAVERFDEVRSQKDLRLESLLLPRIWFETGDGNGLIQVQQDRFHHNWKKVRKEDEYPHYDYVIANFRNHLAEFEDFIKENKLGSVEPVQYEMTYVNHIPQGEGWTTLNDLRKVFPDLAWRTEVPRFLSDPETINNRASFILPNRAGRLHTSIRIGKRHTDRCPIILFELTARGMDVDKSRTAMWAWFNLAHEWIVQGFTDLTSEEMHKQVWRRKR